MAWISLFQLATADEDDLDGGSRGFTIFNRDGEVRFTSGNAVEHLVTRIGHYPEDRSENKGSEPEGIAYGKYGRHRRRVMEGRRPRRGARDRRASTGEAGDASRRRVIVGAVWHRVVVRRCGRRTNRGLTTCRVMRVHFGVTMAEMHHEHSDTPVPVCGLGALEHRGGLPHRLGPTEAGAGAAGRSGSGRPARHPEPRALRGRERGRRCGGQYTLDDHLYALEQGRPSYPTIRSAHRFNGTPIPWGALSALAADRWDPHTLYTAYDSFYRQSRIFALDIRKKPAEITGERVLHRDGETVDLDLEGIVQRPDRGFWAVSEGAGSVDDPARPVMSLNFLLKIATDGEMVAEIRLPDAVNALQRRFGYEGVASVGRRIQTMKRRISEPCNESPLWWTS